MTDHSELMRLAHDIGAKGAAPTEDDRQSFEEWMRGHCHPAGQPARR